MDVPWFGAGPRTLNDAHGAIPIAGQERTIVMIRHYAPLGRP